jgi:hypothetical protein
MKKILMLVLVLITGLISPAKANSEPTIAIIDSGVATSLFANNIAYEVCLLSLPRCPNLQSTMEGPGAANIAPTQDRQLNHGTQMASIVTAVNPSAKIIPIRIVGITPAGVAGLYGLSDVQVALDWVIANRTKYNISAVLLAQGAVMGNCRVPAGMAQSIATLKSANVPVIAAVGNDSNRRAVFSPACLPDAVAVGATDNPWNGTGADAYDPNAAPYIARYSNGAQGQVDFYLNARYYTKLTDGSTKFTVGTSNASAALAGWWLLNRKATFDETFNSIMATTTEAKNEFVTGRYVRLP